MESEWYEEKMKMVKKLSASSQHEKLHRVKQNDIMLTSEMKKSIDRLKKKRKANLSDLDAPEVTDWSHEVIGKFYRPVKKQITVRLDADVLAWFKVAAVKYQTFINLACREYMLKHLKRRK